MYRLTVFAFVLSAKYAAQVVCGRRYAAEPAAYPPMPLLLSRQRRPRRHPTASSLRPAPLATGNRRLLLAWHILGLSPLGVVCQQASSRLVDPRGWAISEERALGTSPARNLWGEGQAVCAPCLLRQQCRISPRPPLRLSGRTTPERCLGGILMLKRREHACLNPASTSPRPGRERCSPISEFTLSKITKHERSATT